MRKILVGVTDQQAAELRLRAHLGGIGVSELVRRLLDASLAPSGAGEPGQRQPSEPDQRPQPAARRLRGPKRLTVDEYFALKPSEQMAAMRTGRAPIPHLEPLGGGADAAPEPGGRGADRASEAEPEVS